MSLQRLRVTDSHLHAEAREHGGAWRGLDPVAWCEVEFEALRNARHDEFELHQRLAGANAVAVTGGEWEICEAVARGDILRREARGIEPLRIRIQVFLTMNGKHRDGDRGALRDVIATDGVVFHRDARDGMDR